MIIFDFDGVLVDSLDQHLGAYKAVFQLYGREFHLDTANDWRERYNSEWEHNFYDGGFSHEEMLEAMGKYFDYLDYSKVDLYEGVPELIRTLADSYTLAICSSTNSEFIQTRLEAEGLADYFELILGSSETSSKLGKLEKLFSTFDEAKESSVYVGDTSADVRAGKEFGVHTIGVTYGWYAPARMASEAPSALAGDVTQLRNELRTLLGETS